jgi:hypothetical protein
MKVGSQKRKKKKISKEVGLLRQMRTRAEN